MTGLDTFFVAIAVLGLIVYHGYQLTTGKPINWIVGFITSLPMLFVSQSVFGWEWWMAVIVHVIASLVSYCIGVQLRVNRGWR